MYNAYLNFFYVRLDDSYSCFQDLKVLKKISSLEITLKDIKGPLAINTV